MRVLLMALVLGLGFASAQAQSVTVLRRQSPVSSVDFSKAKPMPLPQAKVRPAPSAVMPAWPGAPGVSPGSSRAGKLAIPEQAGTSNHPFTTGHANVSSSAYPADAAGRLFFKIGQDTFVCSASLIKPGVAVTAGHCVANFGNKQYYSGWQFVPGYWKENAPFGVWSASIAAVLTSYYEGSAPCAQSGVVCQDDVALILLDAQNGNYPGSLTGWFSYGWNGYSFFPWLGFSQAQITQLGYPVALDGGEIMERTDSLGYTNADLSNNTVIGSLMNGGSSGGPWLVNFGYPAVLSGGITNGSSAAGDIVVGVTSWGYTDQTIKEQGASPFTSGNIVLLINAICASHAAAC